MDQCAGQEDQFAWEHDSVSGSDAEFVQQQGGDGGLRRALAVPVFDDLGEREPELAHVGPGATLG